MKQNRGQVTIEFLFTYGWAILIILIVAIVIWQMGFFNVGGKVTPGSSGFWGVVPEGDVAYSSTAPGQGILIIGISNRVGGNITLLSVDARIQGDMYSDVLLSPQPVITPGATIKWASPSPWQSEDLSAEMPELPPGSNFNVFVTLNYTDARGEAGQVYSSSGWIWGNVEEQGAA